MDAKQAKAAMAAQQAIRIAAAEKQKATCSSMRGGGVLFSLLEFLANPTPATTTNTFVRGQQ